MPTSSRASLSVRGLGKQYRLGQREPYRALRDVLAASASRLFRPARPEDSGRRRSLFWALRDVSFDVEPGEVLGVIGANGAGKTTLLKLISEVTEPTEGEIRVRGRVASLLEVGAGFHPELSGRENIFFNGAVLGMSRAEIMSAFDDIVAFAEVEDFVDTPVKRYSSGMYVRLAFSVVAHLAADILLVDEVLAVGDMDFQKRSRERMREAGELGRSVLLVSHNLALVQSLCARSLLFDRGRLVRVGPTEDVTADYVERTAGRTAVSLDTRADREGDGGIRFASSRSLSSRTGSTSLVSGEGARIELEIERRIQRPFRHCAVEIKVLSSLRQPLLHFWTQYSDYSFAVEHDRQVVVCDIPRLPLEKGTYVYDLTLYAAGAVEDHIKDAGSLLVTRGDFFGHGRTVPKGHSPVLAEHTWSCEGT